MVAATDDLLQDDVHAAVSATCSPRSDELDGLRGIAILIVISKHYGFGQFPGGSELFGVRLFNQFYQAISGVDLFFVLTGYLLGMHLLAVVDTRWYYVTFYRRRVCRTFPLYYIVLLLFTIAVVTRNAFPQVINLDVKWPFGTPWSLVAYTLFFQNFLFAANGYLGPSWLMVTWSLAVQEQFYLLLPCVLRRSPRPSLGYVLAGLIFLAPLSRLALVCLLPVNKLNAYDCLLCCRTDTLGIGVLAAWMLQQEGAKSLVIKGRAFLALAVAVLLLGFSVLTYFGIGLGSKVMYVCGHTYLAVLYVVVVLAALFAADGFWGAILRIGLLRRLGRISYGLFLLHPIVRDLLFLGMFGETKTPDGWNNWPPTLIAFLLTVSLAEVSWHFMEKPIIAWSKSPRRVGQRHFAFLKRS